MLDAPFVKHSNTYAGGKHGYEGERWYSELTEEQQELYNEIVASHDYFSKKDTQYRHRVTALKTLAFALAGANTVVLGLRSWDVDLQANIGLVLSSLVTFISAVLAYFNLEEYWIRNVRVHIQLNMLRDDYKLDAMAHKLDTDRTTWYRDQMRFIQQSNIRYWDKAERIPGRQDPK